MHLLITNLILFFALIIPLGIALAALLLRQAWRRRDKRRSPLKDKLLNLPGGEYLRKQMDKHQDGYGEAMALVLILGPITLSVWLLARMRNVDWSRMQLGIGDGLIAAFALLVLAWCLRKIFNHSTQFRRYREGLDAELAVAQSLTPLIAEGALVFHDFPCDRSNIDHIVIGRSVVFAIETKSRKKPAEKGKDSVRLKYDGVRLTYPNGIVETAPIEQARRQADWLTNFLASGVGEPVRVLPVLALPGWFIDSTSAGSRPDVLVTNCGNPMFMAGEKFGPPMSDAMRKRIAHVLAEKYPTLDEFLGVRA